MKTCPASLFLAALLTAVLPTRAAVFQDEGLQRLFEQGRGEELEREARRQGGPEAQAALALQALRSAEKNQVAQALQLAEACVQQTPQVAACQFALGSALGFQAQQEGVFKALRVVGRVKDSLHKALQLDPAMFEARSLLQTIYLVLPGMAGGSVDKARQLEAEARDSQPEVAKMLRARLAAQAKDWAAAERELASVKLGSDRSFHNEMLNAWSGVGRQWSKTKDYGRAQARYEQLAQQLPGLAQPLYLLGRLAGDQGRHEEAIRLYERARSLSGAALQPLDYRVGVAWMDLGDKDKARQFLQRYLQDRRANASYQDDARKRLRELG